jgi:lipopolysaccharide/colanic/teichoic acid biosynthesis glycosyltransferase
MTKDKSYSFEFCATLVIENLSLKKDVEILVKTIKVVLLEKYAY